MKQAVIRVEGIYKDFVLPQERQNSVKSIFTSVMGRSVNTSKTTQHALKDISFEVNKGEFFGIVGRNGSGKSTLLKIIAGIYKPTKGKISTSGKLVPFIELGVGFNPELTGRENVYLNGAILGFTEAEIDANYQGIVDFAELEQFMDQKLKNYSSGMQVRLAFSCATRAKADILLVDEVLAVGDADFQRKCFDYFRKLKKQGTTVIFVTHDMGAVREYCDRAILIEDKMLIHSGTSNQVAGEYTRLFLPEEYNQQENSSTEDDRVRWGNRKIYVEKIVSKKRVIPEDKDVLITLICKSKEDVDSPIIGIKVTDPQGKGLLGINTKIAKIDLGLVKKGEVFDLSFSFPNILNEGLYDVTVAIESKELDTLDWWEEATSFRIVKEKVTGYPIEPAFEIKVKKIK